MFEFEFFLEFCCILCWALFWPFLTFLAIFDTSSRVTSPKLFWVGKPSPNEFDEGAHTLFGICPTRICMISNLFRTQLYISLGFVLAIFDIFGHF